MTTKTAKIKITFTYSENAQASTDAIKNFADTLLAGDNPVVEIDVPKDCFVVQRVPDYMQDIREDTLVDIFAPRLSYATTNVNPLTTESDNIVYAPLYLYRHGADALSLTEFSCPWDSGMCGYAVITKERAAEWGFTPADRSLEEWQETLKNGVQLYDHAINGRHWSLIEETVADGTVFFMTGYGDSLEEVGFLNEVADSLHEAVKEAWENRYDNC
jgi:hypothetical protein